MEPVLPDTVTIRSGQDPSEMLILAPDCKRRRQLEQLTRWMQLKWQKRQKNVDWKLLKLLDENFLIEIENWWNLGKSWKCGKMRTLFCLYFVCPTKLNYQQFSILPAFLIVHNSMINLLYTLLIINGVNRMHDGFSEFWLNRFKIANIKLEMFNKTPD